ncbi:preprotein translocase subunit YajC [Porphyromonas sp.]|uniref:preprotein translocase subunit YajC n=1 Tax=Porphyromonas sp. TaxID=1924944 RepID=UPI0026DC3796|nr:preprotein translocase subunit YajC [Porphyromonas sp.]MDO4770849.1 preprotein translocase subunit YajC [Porphyromonas sp.]
MNFLNILLQTAAAGGNSGLMQIGMIVLMVVIFYFFIIRPQSKKQKDLQKAREALKVGDKIITAGGIYGVIRDINRETGVIIAEVWEGVKFKVDMNSVYAVSEQSGKGR